MLPSSDMLQIEGAVAILIGYWRMGKDIRSASLFLVIGCVIWAYWSMTISPRAYWMGALEVTLGAMSARTFWINRRK